MAAILDPDSRDLCRNNLNLCAGRGRGGTGGGATRGCLSSGWPMGGPDTEPSARTMDQVGRPLCYSYSDGYRTISEDYRPGRLTTVLPIF